jgi:tRNA1(Val) A37 N6-methylase TrmN6
VPFDFSKKPFTYHYSQPREYRFSLDSIEMACRLGMEFRERALTGPLRILDLCAGCGVLGFEFHFFERRVQSIDFVEVQGEYRDHFAHNRALVDDDPSKFRFLEQNYETLCSPEYAERYQLVLCNPPYFRAGHGTLAPSQFKNRCRFFLDSTFEQLVTCVGHVLAPGGEAYIILRALAEHGFDALEEFRRFLPGNCSLEVCEPVRTAQLLKVSKTR